MLGNLWNARVTSHIPLSQVAVAISEDAIAAAADARRSVHARRRLRSRRASPSPASIPMRATAAISAARRSTSSSRRFDRRRHEGFAVEGPFPSDTVFLRAKNGDFDAVLTMYHDQGQIAMKLMGFDRGVTLIGGFPFPICTPAHGTAYEIAGRGIANLGASREALLLAIRMAAAARSKRTERRAPL